jgi:hypothetical protein
MPAIAEPNNAAAGAAELPLQGLNSLNGRVEMLLKKLFENVHGITEAAYPGRVMNKDIIAGPGF